jgi:hypothetical protein
MREVGEEAVERALWNQVLCEYFLIYTRILETTLK